MESIIKLTSLYKDRGKWYVDFAYYDNEGNWTGEYEDCHITENQLYRLLFPYLEMHHKEAKCH